MEEVDSELWAAYMAAEEEGIKRQSRYSQDISGNIEIDQSQASTLVDNEEYENIEDAVIQYLERIDREYTEKIEKVDDAVLQYLESIDRDLKKRQNGLSLEDQPSNVSRDEAEDDLFLFEQAMAEVEKVRSSQRIAGVPILVSDDELELMANVEATRPPGSCRDCIVIDDVSTNSNFSRQQRIDTQPKRPRKQVQQIGRAHV